MHTYKHISETRPEVKPDAFNSSQSVTSTADAPPPSVEVFWLVKSEGVLPICTESQEK